MRNGVFVLREQNVCSVSSSYLALGNRAMEIHGMSFMSVKMNETHYSSMQQALQ